MLLRCTRGPGPHFGARLRTLCASSAIALKFYWNLFTRMFTKSNSLATASRIIKQRNAAASHRIARRVFSGARPIFKSQAGIDFWSGEGGILFWQMSDRAKIAFCQLDWSTIKIVFLHGATVEVVTKDGPINFQFATEAEAKTKFEESRIRMITRRTECF